MNRENPTMRKCKIVCTIGPATDSVATIDRLIENGMDAARLNFSHGTRESHAAAVKAIRQAAERRRVAAAIIQDLQGPRIRVGELPDQKITVKTGQPVRLTTMLARSGGQLGTEPLVHTHVTEIPITYQFLSRDIRPGARILIDDGLIELVCDRITGGFVECTVTIGGNIASHKGINLPGTFVSAPALTDKDREDLRFGISQGVDYVALSFVRSPEDIIAARTFIAQHGGNLPIIAKIERAEAVTALDAILAQADGVMIARGDLGVEMGPEAVPVLQKRIINSHSNARIDDTTSAAYESRSLGCRQRSVRRQRRGHAFG